MSAPTSTSAQATSPSRVNSALKSSSSVNSPAPLPEGRKLRIYLTGYTYHDNTPPGSPVICCPVLHEVAGGTGTYEDPITVAVPGSGSSMEWPAGTRFYLPSIKRYVIVEDSGASETPPDADTHLDLWVDGTHETHTEAEDRAERITGYVSAELDPPPGRVVGNGPLAP